MYFNTVLFNFRPNISHSWSLDCSSFGSLILLNQLHLHMVSGKRKRMLSVEFFLTNQRFFCPAYPTSSPGSFAFQYGGGRREDLATPPLQFGPLTYQPIEWGFISSNQSALWSCLLHVTSQLGEGCSMSFVRFSVLIVWNTCVWNSFGAFSLMGFWRILQKFEVCSKLSSVNAYFHMLES